MSLILALQRQRQEFLCEFKDNLVYMVSCQSVKAYLVRPVSE